MSSRFRLALIQMCVERHREKNLTTAVKLIREAAKNGAKIVALPEYFTCWMDPKYFVEYKEPVGGPTVRMLAQAARDNRVFLFGGTIPEEIEGSNMLNNTCNIFNPNGDLIAHFKKLHLFDVDLGPGLHIRESELNMKGTGLTVVDTGFCKVGFGVCLDLRFPEVARLYGKRGCRLLTYMGGFGLKTGAAHWVLLQRTRAVDNQVFVANVGPARNDNSPYVTYGHSAVVDPWGDIISSTAFEQDIVYADIDLSYLDEVRRRMPLDEQRRDDLFQTVYIPDSKAE